ncbi:MAG: nuclear transport factor 2 family protein [Sphingomonas sp.]|nr:nuclear transport factor 2 family protein [Sphingomonas sp.]
MCRRCCRVRECLQCGAWYEDPGPCRLRRTRTTSGDNVTTRHQAIRNAVVAGDQVALEVDWTGTPAIDLGSMKAGQQITLRGASFITIAAGKLTRIVDLS